MTLVGLGIVATLAVAFVQASNPTQIAYGLLGLGVLGLYLFLKYPKVFGRFAHRLLSTLSEMRSDNPESTSASPETPDAHDANTETPSNTLKGSPKSEDEGSGELSNQGSADAAAPIEGVRALTPGPAVTRPLSPGPTLQQHSNSPILGQAVKDQFAILRVPVKNELRKARGASAYDAVFEMAFIDIMCRFATIDGPIRPEQGQVYLDVMRALHPKTYARLNALSGVELLQNHLNARPQLKHEQVKKPMLVSLVQDFDRANRTSYSTGLTALMCTVAKQIALADGTLSSAEIHELEGLQTILHGM